MIKITPTTAFKRDVKKLDFDLSKFPVWIEVMDCFENRKKLPKARQDHKMKGEYKKYRNCHIKPDLVLLYERKGDCIILHRIDTHSELKI